MRDDLRLKITEIFLSLQGESTTSGLPTVFIRLTGCPLRCSYCDTEYAFTGGEWMALDDIIERVAELGACYVTVTGGEPLAQKPCIDLLRRLCDAGYEVSLETSGALPIGDVDPRVRRVVDMKTPGSGEVERNLYDNLQLLQEGDEVKFVICDEKDYDWSQRLISEYSLTDRCGLLYSPSYGEQDPTQLADWMIRDLSPARLQLQLHKLLWGDEQGR